MLELSTLNLSLLTILILLVFIAVFLLLDWLWPGYEDFGISKESDDEPKS